jgi:hypothetical protein
MKRIICTVLIGWIATACSADVGGLEEDDSIESVTQELTYAPVGPLTRKAYINSNEASRKANTDNYYDSTSVSANGVDDLGTISSALSTLDDFIAWYGFDSTESTTYYYNRGDLGIGREMHCVDRFNVTGQIACYVKNFAAGDDQSEFRFGMSKDIAFKNMDAHAAFATVAMVFRNSLPAGKKILFAVYDDAGDLANAAPLDRHGFNFARNLRDNTGALGTPGVNFNNHIPSNCLNCHGGTYNAGTSTTNPTVTGTFFLPFDLDQFEYQNKSGKTRTDQLLKFKQQNDIVRKVAASSGSSNSGQITTQIDGWYNSGSFNSAYIPTGWNANANDRNVYTSVVRGSCRGCHITSSIPFADAASFRAVASTIASDVCSLAMPHALQTTREFWQSTKPASLEAYFRANNLTAAADSLHNCSAGNVVTLDPDRVLASSILE